MRKRLSGLISELEALELAREDAEAAFGASPRDHTNSLFRFTDVLPVVGFNSQKYDINVIKAPLVKPLVDAHQDDEEEIEIEINAIDSGTLLALNAFAQSCVGPRKRKR